VESYYDKIPKTIFPRQDENNRYVYSLMDDNGIQRNVQRNRLLGIVYLPNPNNLPEVDHINRMPWDDRLENLRWVTKKENCKNRNMVDKSKKIALCDKNGSVIREFKNSTEAVNMLNLTTTSKVISQCARRNETLTEKYKTSMGYVWRYLV